MPASIGIRGGGAVVLTGATTSDRKSIMYDLRFDLDHSTAAKARTPLPWIGLRVGDRFFIAMEILAITVGGPPAEPNLNWAEAAMQAITTPTRSRFRVEAPARFAAPYSSPPLCLADPAERRGFWDALARVPAGSE
jgi:hypothetical protein